MFVVVSHVGCPGVIGVLTGLKISYGYLCGDDISCLRPCQYSSQDAEIEKGPIFRV